MPAFPLLVAALVGGLLGSAPEVSNQERAGAEAPVVIRCGELLAEPGSDPITGGVVVVLGGRIAAVGGPDLDVPSDAMVIDLSDQFVMPGLVDCHVHLSMEFTPDIRIRSLQESDADRTIRAIQNGHKTLLAGFTTVRDVGSGGDAVFAVRDAIERGEIRGPRILASGEAVTPTGGHGDETNGFRDDLLPPPTTETGVADGEDACRRAVRRQVQRGADCIKLTATGGVLSNIGAGTEQQLFEDELEAIVETSHMLGKRVASHAHGVRGIKAAVRAGVDSIEHGTFLDDEAIGLMKEHGTYLVATIIAGKTVAKNAEVPGYYPAAVAAKARTVGPVIQDAFGRAYKGGVKIAFGTDAGVCAHGINATEFVYMTEAGMPSDEAIVSATVRAAELCGVEGLVGRIRAGMEADIIATARSPISDITELQRVRFVMKGGEIVKRDGQSLLNP
jgi:imidazolonepropionase-like amidohydrolase